MTWKLPNCMSLRDEVVLALTASSMKSLTAVNIPPRMSTSVCSTFFAERLAITIPDFDNKKRLWIFPILPGWISFSWRILTNFVNSVLFDPDSVSPNFSGEKFSTISLKSAISIPPAAFLASSSRNSTALSIAPLTVATVGGFNR